MRCLTILTLAVLPFCGAFGLTGDANLSMSEREYVRYIKPQLKSLIFDFNQYLKAKTVTSSKIFPTETTLLPIMKATYDYKKACTTPINDVPSCEKSISDLRIALKDFDNTLNSLLTELVSDNSTNCMVINATGCMLQIHFLIEIINRNSILLSKFDSMLIPGEKPKIESILYLLNENRIYFEILLVAPLTGSDKDDTYQLIRQFLYPLIDFVLVSDDTNLFLKQTGQLGLTWYNFHLKVSKWDRETSQQELKILNNIHFRWNSVLKIIKK